GSTSRFLAARARARYSADSGVMKRERGWLQQTLSEAVSTFSPDTGSRAAIDSKALASPRARARRYLKLALRQSGLLYGTPKGVAEAADPGAALFGAVVKTLANIALDLAVILEAAPAPRREP